MRARRQRRPPWEAAVAESEVTASGRERPRAEMHNLGQELADMRATFLVREGTVQGWIEQALREVYDIDDPSAESAKAAKLEIRSAIRCQQMGKVRKAGRRGKRDLSWRAAKAAPGKRLRNVGSGRPVLAEEIGDELWLWFIDRLRNTVGRTSSNLLLVQGHILVADLKERWHKL